MSFLHDFFADISGLTPASSYTLADHVAAAAQVILSGGGGGGGSWSAITGKPTYIGAGSTQAAARTAIGAGSSDVVIGSASGQAADAAATTTAINAKYTKPGSGIPSTDLTSAAQTSLGKADTALQGTALVASTDKVASIQITDDGTATGSWPNRLEFLFKPVSLTAKLTSYFNEYGEFRGVSGKVDTVPFRLFGKNAPGDAAHTANIIEVDDDRTTRTVLFSVATDGTVTAPNIGAKVIVLATAASVPPGTPAGTVILRTP